MIVTAFIYIYTVYKISAFKLSNLIFTDLVNFVNRRKETKAKCDGSSRPFYAQSMLGYYPLSISRLGLDCSLFVFPLPVAIFKDDLPSYAVRSVPQF